MQQNSFLRNFMQMRASLKEGKPAHVKVAESKDMSLDELIADKPAPKIVTEYFRKRVNQLFQDG